MRIREEVSELEYLLMDRDKTIGELRQYITELEQSCHAAHDALTTTIAANASKQEALNQQIKKLEKELDDESTNNVWLGWRR